MLDQIIRHPKTFLKSNALWVSGAFQVACKAKPDNKVWPIRLQRTSMVECKNSAGLDLPCWEILPAFTLGYSSLAYFLPWYPNSTKEMVLGTAADLFLTDTMNGCSFGYGPGGTPRVAHLNYNVQNSEGVREEGLAIDQTHINSEINRIFPGGATTLKKADYAVNTDGQFPNVTVIGVRDNGMWRFVYQRRAYVGVANGKKSFKLLSVHTVR
jgi:hypothetical protein